MRADFLTKNQFGKKEWEDAKMYQRRQELNQGKPHFTSLHDGPPYANGNIHALDMTNKISKDIIVRSKSMSVSVPLRSCWDTVFQLNKCWQNKGVKRKELDRAEYLKMYDYNFTS